MTFANAVSEECWKQRSNYSELRSGWESEEVKIARTCTFEMFGFLGQERNMAIAGRRHWFLFRWEKCCWSGSSKSKKIKL